MSHLCEDEIADALIYGRTPTLRAKAPGVVLHDDGRVSLDPGTRVIHAPLTHTAARGHWRKWPASEKSYHHTVVAEDGDYVEIRANPSCSLFGMMAESNCGLTNALGKSELIAVWWCVMNDPFPLGGGVEQYRRVLAKVEGDALARATATLSGRTAKTALGDDAWAVADTMSLGQIRQYLVNKAGGGCNAPVDSYLRIAVSLVDGEEPQGY